MNITTPLHPGMIRCQMCGTFNIFTARDIIAIPGLAKCHRCRLLLTYDGTDTLTLTEVNA